jgi:hypothetical protein
MWTKISSDKTLTEKQAYEAMLYMLNAYWKLTGSTNLIDILGGGSYIFEDTPSDSLFWEYWLAAVEKVRRDGAPPIMELS